MKKLLIFLIFIYTLNSNLFAQVVAGSSFFDEMASGWNEGFSLDMESAFTPKSDFKNNSDGQMGVFESSGVLKFQAFNKLQALSVNLGYTYSYYDFSDTNDKLFSNVNNPFISIFYTLNVYENFGVFAIFNSSFCASSNAKLENAGTFFGGGGINYNVNKNLKFGIGVMGYSRLDDSTIAIPIAYLNWKINDKLELKTFSGATLSYDVFGNKTLFFVLTCQYMSNYIKLEENSSNGNSSVKDSYMQTSVSATYNFENNMYISASIGGNFFRELKFRQNSQTSQKIQIDPSPVFYLNLGYKF